MPKCPFPNCTGVVIKERCPHGICLTHEKFVADLIFILPHIRFGEKTPEGEEKSRLVKPGEPGFTLPPAVGKPL